MNIQTKNIFREIEEKAKELPEKIAVIEGGKFINYQKINATSNQLAHYLLAKKLPLESIVMTFLPRGIDLIVAHLGINKMGGAFLPLDPTTPSARVKTIFEDSNAKYIITSKVLTKNISSLSNYLIYIEDILTEEGNTNNPNIDVAPNNLAYVIYTSGSTGTPKGVMIEQRNFTDFSHWHSTFYKINDADRVTHLASPSFDASIADIWPTLIKGASLYIPDEDTKMSPLLLKNWMIDNGITLSLVTTPLGELLLKEQWPQQLALRGLTLAGDRFHFYPSENIPFLVYNYYGPTENTVVSTAGIVPTSGEEKFPSIGKACQGKDVYILDHLMKPVKDGEIGEVYLGGNGVARGYLGREDLTRELFIPDIFSQDSGRRLYKSGDLAFRNKDSQIHFIGRKDSQIKIRGNRVELAEIVTALKKYPLIGDAFVKAEYEVAENKDSIFLIAYIIPMDSSCIPSVKLIREYLEQIIPSFMVPKHFITLNAFPLKESGKIDVNALPSMHTGVKRNRGGVKTLLLI